MRPRLSPQVAESLCGFRPWRDYVFDISQTEGQELPEIGNVNGYPREFLERLGKFVTDQGILLEYSQDIAPAKRR